MTRKKYIEYRLKQSNVAVLYAFALSHGYKGTLLEFSGQLLVWSQTPIGQTPDRVLILPPIDFYLDKVFEYYDDLFEITLCFRYEDKFVVDSNNQVVKNTIQILFDAI